MKNNPITYFFSAVICTLIFSCNPTKHLQEGESLYKGYDIEIENPHNVSKKGIESELEDVIRIKPNRKTFGIRWRLGFYNFAGPNPKSKFKKRMRNEWGEAPVLLQDANAERTEELMENRLENNGFFYSSVSHEVNTKRRKSTVKYNITLDRPYHLAEYSLLADSSDIMKDISKYFEENELVKGQRYELQKMKEERDRINVRLKNMGYYNFNPDFLIFEVDTALGSREFNLALRIKKDAPAGSLDIYRINKTIINADYTLRDDTKLPENYINYKDKFTLNDPLELFNPRVFSRAVYWEEGSEYSLDEHRSSLSYLSRLGVFSYSNVLFRPDTESDDPNLLNAYILASPKNKISQRFETSLITRSNGFTGPSVGYTWGNRNLTGHAEQLNLKVEGGFETQLPRRQEQVLNSIEFGASAEYVIPRIIIPYRDVETPMKLIGQTVLSGAYNFLNRTSFFSLNSIKLAYTYKWSRHSFRHHEFSPLSINLVQLRNTSEVFEEILDGNPLLRRSFEQQFIFGLSYSFTFNNIGQKDKKHNFYNNLTFDSSGNLPTTIASLVRNRPVDSSDPFRMLGVPFSQHVRIYDEFRYYYKFTEETKIVFRLAGGVGYAYGNSTAMPYLKQFFSGGPSSIRAFRVRSLGPGTFRPDITSAFTFFDQTGDIRLESNIEFRFPIISIVKGALFVDAGNVWNFRENESLPGGKFSSQWYKELAMGTGFGIRVDANIIIIRLDIATPIRKPWLPEGERTVLDEFKLKNKGWRQENLIFNLSLGYPF